MSATAPPPSRDELVRRVVALAHAGVGASDLARVLRDRGDAPGAEAVVAALESRRGAPLPSPEAEVALSQLGARVLLADESAYPRRLAELWPHGGAPLWLFAVGPLPDGPAAAVVGTRQPTAAGIETASWLGAGLSEAGVTVVSGLARGIDQAAHRGALSAGGATVGVLGAGLDVDYPRGDGELREAIAESGGLVTELPCGAAPHPRHFLARNRIIAGLADVTVVVEGRARSGALATAHRAAEQGREVLAVPGSPLAAASAGPNGLLRDGATPVTALSDVVDAVAVARGGQGAHGAGRDEVGGGVGPADTTGAGARDSRVRRDQAPAPESKESLGLDEVAAGVLAVLGPTPVGADALVRATGRPIGDVLAAVGRLVTRGLATHGPTGVASSAARTYGPSP